MRLSEWSFYPKDMPEVVLKDELHSNDGELDEEREIVKDGIDVLILELDDPKMESDYGIFDDWLHWSVVLFFWFLETVYLSKIVRENLADDQDADMTNACRSEACVNRTW